MNSAFAHRIQDPECPGSPPWGSESGATIVGLAAAIAGSFGRNRAAGGELANPAVSAAISEARHIVLLLLDGFGERQLQTLRPAGALAACRAGTLHSVFPTSTAPAITSFATARFPGEHANPGWFCWSDAHGAVVRTLPMDLRGSPGQMLDSAVLWDWQSASLESRVPVLSLQPDFIADSSFTRHAWAGATRGGYRNVDDLVATVDVAVRANPGGAWIWAYLPQFDAISHEHGWASDTAAGVAGRFDRVFERLAARLDGTGALLLATADHGFVDVPPAQRLRLDDFPAVAELLDRPLCGEPRIVYCQPKAGHGQVFEAAVREHLGFAFDVVRTEALLQAGWFGPGAVSPKLAGRIGSHVLVGRDRFTLVDCIEGEPEPAFIGMHGGIHPDEILVPLIAARDGAALPTAATTHGAASLR